MERGVEDKLRQVLSEWQTVEFALPFGSSGYGKTNPMSDIDLGVHLTEEPELIDLGGMVSALERELKRDVDLVVLNKLYRRSPSLAYEIISKGRLLFCRARDRLIEFRRVTYLYYLDHKPLIETNQRMLLKRLREGTFGEVTGCVKKTTGS